jgi:hypothetical protein
MLRGGIGGSRANVTTHRGPGRRCSSCMVLPTLELQDLYASGPGAGAARLGRAAPSGYPRRPRQPRPRAAASPGAPRMTHVGQDRRARGRPGPATGAARAGGHRAGLPSRPTGRSTRPRAVGSNARARDGPGPPKRPCGTRAAPSAPSPCRQRCTTPRRAHCLPTRARVPYEGNEYRRPAKLTRLSHFSRMRSAVAVLPHVHRPLRGGVQNFVRVPGPSAL